ncbi:amidohydrolase family protein [Agrobacterium tumefaciens]|uniref:Amidohydrolase family protein n=1 Tax=Agrobacterium tumefaciens TaxID=358 RepID=A0AA44JA80_AGRTU|nr:amidohydrolase family protein [Agrobacterium tumefaciens]NTB87565.1 amidohydrolase family protein [Agrobacterium tumefaciens]NTC19740.1 amidohydrolase family protein [Agrobacterium tumefaciens]NTC29668.1 amidohydrolase family protein [Agrobacterium tumefaciens]
MAIQLPLPSPESRCDTHVHVFEPALYPYAEDRAYTPGEASCGDLEDLMSSLEVGRCVIVQPSVYGSDNTCLLAALEYFGAARARGVAVIDHQGISTDELHGLREAGVRALRVNFEAVKASAPVDRISVIRGTARRAAEAGLAVQLYVDTATAVEAASDLAEEGVPLILDHFAGFRCGMDLKGETFSKLVEVLEAGNVWVKLSAPYRTGSKLPDYEDLRPAAQAMIAAAPDRMVWASDWPHTGGGQRDGKDPARVEPFRHIDDRSDLSRLRRWVDDDGLYQEILADNAARVFDFQDAR